MEYIRLKFFVLFIFREKLVWRQRRECGKSLYNLLTTDEIFKTPCSFLTRWKLSLGLEESDEETEGGEQSHNFLLNGSDKDLTFPWKRVPTISQARKMGLVYPAAEERSKTFISERLKILKQNSIDTASRSSATDTNQAQQFEFDQWCDDSSTDEETADEATHFGNDGVWGKNVIHAIESFSPGYKVVISIHRQDFHSADSIWNNHKLVSASFTERMVLKFGEEVPDVTDEQLIAAFRP